LCTGTVDGRLNVNVALNRPSYLSSVLFGGAAGPYGSFGPEKGNDGDKTNCNGLVIGQSIAHTEESEVNPWYAVDLGVALEVFGVKLTNRVDMNRK